MENPNDKVLSLADAAVRLRVTEKRLRNMAIHAQLQPVRTPLGVGYTADDIEALRLNREMGKRKW